jgi:hypothetical protein
LSSPLSVPSIASTVSTPRPADHHVSQVRDSCVAFVASFYDLSIYR